MLYNAGLPLNGDKKQLIEQRNYTRLEHILVRLVKLILQTDYFLILHVILYYDTLVFYPSLRYIDISIPVVSFLLYKYWRPMILSDYFFVYLDM